MSACRSCGAPMRWARTSNGKAMPLDAEPDDTGNVVIIDGHAETHISAGRAEEVRPGMPRYMPHHATCPQADDWRR